MKTNNVMQLKALIKNRALEAGVSPHKQTPPSADGSEIGAANLEARTQALSREGAVFGDIDGLMADLDG